MGQQLRPRVKRRRRLRRMKRLKQQAKKPAVTGKSAAQPARA